MTEPAADAPAEPPTTPDPGSPAEPAASEDPELTELIDRLYGDPPTDFVAVRDDAVRAAREGGKKDLARAVSRLRRPTRAAWLANLLARHRSAELAGLLGLAGSLADAQRTLDGEALRALSTRRRQLVTAMGREAGRLARAAHEPVNDSLLRELQEILEAGLADPAVAAEVTSGRMTRTVSYSGFGPVADDGTVPRPAPPRPAATREPAADDTEDDPVPDRDTDRERRDRERRERERVERVRAVEELAEAEQQARDRRADADAAAEDAAAAHAAASDRVTELTAELDAAQRRERSAAGEARDATAAARTAAREAGAAATRTARARARVEEIPDA